MEKKRIDFTASAFPAITNYQKNQVDPEDATKKINYASIFGKYPDVRLFWFDENGDWIPWMQPPKYGIVAEVLDSIVWNIGDPITGFIIIS